MAASVDPLPQDEANSEQQVHYVVSGTGTSNDDKVMTGVMLVDPSTGAPYAATAGNASNTVALHDTTTPAHGATVTSAGALVVDTQDPAPAIYSHTFVATGTGTSVDGSANPPVAYSLQVVGVAATATSWTVTLELSLDNATWVTALTHQSGTNADGAIVHTTAYPALYMRAHVTALVLGPATGLGVYFVGKS